MHLPRPIQLLAGSLYAAAATLFVALAVFALGDGPAPSAIAAVAAGLLGVVTVDTGRREFRDAFFSETVETARLQPSDAADALAVAVAGPLTFAVSVSLGQGPVVASALVGLFAALTVDEQAAPAYCGSFVGMVSAAVLPTLGPVAAASLVAAVVYVLAKRVFNGFGGKLGTTAFVGCTAVVVPTSYTYAPASALSTAPAAAALVAATGGAVAAFLLSVHYDHGAVVGSATVGLVAGLLAPPLFAPELAGVVATAAFAGSFVGMVSTTRLPSLSLVTLAGLLSGFVYVGVTPAFAGSGGKLGTVAFTACLLMWGLDRALDDPALAN
ncbi:hypothetical protein [Salinibaculum rarum]|uniref:hypothetical protein n=1 Tax=Salinibaculum rarum TaxID=3058903 RepID=UPI00265E3D1A|nr:hypothetical protein [Salinibaculum sp. KK48]